MTIVDKFFSVFGFSISLRFFRIFFVFIFLVMCFGISSDCCGSSQCPDCGGFFSCTVNNDRCAGIFGRGHIRGSYRSRCTPCTGHATAVGHAAVFAPRAGPLQNGGVLVLARLWIFWIEWTQPGLARMTVWLCTSFAMV